MCSNWWKFLVAQLPPPPPPQLQKSGSLSSFLAASGYRVQLNHRLIISDLKELKAMLGRSNQAILPMCPVCVNKLYWIVINSHPFCYRIGLKIIPLLTWRRESLHYLTFLQNHFNCTYRSAFTIFSSTFCAVLSVAVTQKSIFKMIEKQPNTSQSAFNFIFVIFVLSMTRRQHRQQKQYIKLTYYMSLLAIKKSYMRNCLGLRADPLYPYLSWWFIIILKLVVEPLHFLLYSDKLYCFAGKIKNERSLIWSRRHSDTAVPTQTKSRIRKWTFQDDLIPVSLFLSNKSWMSV